MRRERSVQFLGLAVAIGIASGVASGLFLEALRIATETRDDHAWLLYLLPLASAAIAWLYAGSGKSAAGGDSPVLDQIHDQRAAGVPLRMFPLIRAHEAGPSSAAVYRSGMGFIGSGPIIDDSVSEIAHPRLIVCIELLGSRDALRSFVDRHAAALRRAIVEYARTERWGPLPAHRLIRRDGGPRAHPVRHKKP